MMMQTLWRLKRVILSSVIFRSLSVFRHLQNTHDTRLPADDIVRGAGSIQTQ
jgi:hypothetical protein